MSNAISSLDWDLLFSNKKVKECYKVFLKKYSKVCDNFIPRVVHKISKKRPPWMTNNLLRLIWNKRTMWFKICASNQANKRSIRVKYNELVREIEIKTRTAYERNFIHDKSNPKKLYAYVNDCILL